MKVLPAFAAMLAAPVWLGVSAANAQEAVEAQAESFGEALGDTAYLLSRTVIHAMPDGREIAVTRTYRVRFAPFERGWQVEGESVDVQVDAPPHLAALADLERRRDDSGTFPMRLTGGGMLTPVDAVRPTDSDTAAKAGEMVVAQIGESDQDDGVSKRAAAAAARALVAAGQRARIAWPVDLFRPAASQRVESGEVDGGTITVALSAKSDPQTGLMRHFERRVTTRIGASERVVTERWELRPEPQAESSDK